MKRRQDLKLSPNVTEEFFYDALNRFDYSTRKLGAGSPATNADVTLDAIGNISWKLGVGNYAYHATQKRAVVSAGSNSYGYDANGNMNSRNGASIGYTSYNLPTVINAPGNYSSTMSYGAFRNRFKQVAVGPQGSETTIYVAGLLEKVSNAQGTHYRHTIRGGAGTAAIHSRTVGGSNATFYLHRDHLGSPELITDASGNVLVRPSFAAYGERRDGSDWDGPPSSGDLNTLAGITRRGFTGHEHLDAVGLIHMNGRVYEPVAGRFLSVDPIRIRGLPQDSNPYSYGWNNPIRIVDPSGWKEEDLETKREREDDPPAGPPTPVGPVVVTNTPIAPPLSPPVHVPIVAGDIGSSFGEVGFGGNSPQPPEPKQEDEPPPCGNGQTQEPQGQRKLMRLPQNAEESGYYNYGTPGGGEGQFGRPETIQLILDVGHSWARTGASDFGVGNISLEDGSYFPPHSPTGSHTTGFGFDVRPMRLDGAASPSTWTSSKYDRAATQALVDQFVSTGRVRNILFNDPKIRGVSPSQGHDNHLHVNVKPSCKK